MTRLAKLLHLSDPHFGTVHKVVAEALISKVHELGPQIALVTGDVTQRAHRTQFKDAKVFFDALRLPWYAVPGNHDIPLFNIVQRFNRPYQSYLSLFSDRTEHEFRCDGVSVTLMNSTDPWRHVDGDLNLKHLETRLSCIEPSAVIRVLALHHPLDCPGPSDEKNIVRHAQSIAALCSKYRVDLILGGHIHNPVTRLSLVRYPDIERPFVVSVAGTCLSHRTRPPSSNSFGLISLEDNLITIERYELNHDNLFWKAQCFEFVKRAGVWSEHLKTDLVAQSPDSGNFK